MKKPEFLWILIFLFWSSLSLFSQSAGRSYTNQISGMKITNKLTGEVIDDKELTNFKTNYPNSIFEPVIDKYGNIEAYEIDPSKTDGIMTRDETKRVGKGEPFPPFVMKSISKKNIDSEKLKGLPVLIQFQVSFNKPFFSEKVFSEIDSLVTYFRKTKAIEAIVVTEDSKEEITSSFIDGNFVIVPDGRNFNQRYLILAIPSIVLIDKKGNLVSYYNSKDFARLKADLNELD